MVPRKGKEVNPPGDGAGDAATLKGSKRPAEKADAEEPGADRCADDDDQLDALSRHADMACVTSDKPCLSDDGSVSLRVSFKPQSKRFPLAVMMSKDSAEGSKWKQRMQIVIKTPLLAVDAMLILKFLATDVLDGKCTDFEVLKGKRAEYISYAESGMVLQAFEKHRPRDDASNERLKAFMMKVEERYALELELKELAPAGRV